MASFWQVFSKVTFSWKEAQTFTTETAKRSSKEPVRVVDQQFNVIKEIIHEGVMRFNNTDKISWLLVW